MQCSGMSSPAAASDAASLSSHRALLSSILSYLASLKQSPHASSLLLSTDSLDAALDCLVEATGLPRPSAVSAAPPALPDIFQAGQAALALPSAAASAPSDSDSAAHFSQFVSLLTDRRFFAGLQPGSAAYSDRLAAARQKFDDKYGSGTSSQQWPPQTDSVSETDMRRAEQLKAEGNTYLSSQQYDAAVARYTSALELNPHSAIYYGNRAAAYINLSQWSDAERDCRDAIRIEPHYGKAHYRLGQSLMGQSRVQEAIASFESALQYTDASMRATIDEQLAAARRQVHGAAGQDSHDTSDELDSGGGGGFGGLDFASLLSSPMMQQMAEQFAGGAGGEGGLDFNALLNNPQLMQMASSLFGGSGGSAAGGGGNSGSRSATPSSRLFNTSPTVPSLPSLNAFLNSPAAASLSSDPDLAPVLDDVRANGQSALARHMNNPQLIAKLSNIAAQMSAAGSSSK